MVHDEGSEQGDQGTIEVVYAGGEVNIEAAHGSLRVAGAPSFETGKKYLMMKRDDGSRYFSPIVGRSNGLFQVIEDSGTGTEYVLSTTGEAMLSASAQRVITSDRKLCRR